MTKKQPKRKHNKNIVPVTVAISVLIAVVLALCLGGGGAVDRLQKAAGKTLLAENFTANFSFDINGEATDGFMNVTANRAEKKLEMYMAFTTRAGDYYGGIYDSKFVLCDTASNDTIIIDIENQVNAFFDARENGQPDWAVLLDIDEYNLHSAINQDFDFDVLLTCLGDFLKNLNSASWAETYAGYSKGKENGVTQYSFRPDPYVLVTQTLPIFQPAFRNPQDYKNLQAYVDDAKFLLTQGKADFSYGIKNGRLVSADFALQYHDTDMTCSLSFTDIGSTTVDISTIAFILEEERA